MKNFFSKVKTVVKVWFWTAMTMLGGFWCYMIFSLLVVSSAGGR